MRKPHSKMCLTGVAALLIFLISGTATAKCYTASMNQIAELIAKVRKGETPQAQRDAAEHLAEAIRGIQPEKVDDQTLVGIVSLLDISDDPVRFWVAASLGTLGPRAKTAVPKLQKILTEVDCLQGSLTSADAIRHALTRIGVTPPPPPNCETKKGKK